MAICRSKKLIAVEILEAEGQLETCRALDGSTNAGAVAQQAAVCPFF